MRGSNEEERCLSFKSQLAVVFLGPVLEFGRTLWLVPGCDPWQRCHLCETGGLWWALWRDWGCQVA